jgi:predicted metal-binding membrane protein
VTIREPAWVRNRVLAVSASAWALLLLRPGGMAHCSVAVIGTPSQKSLAMLLAMNPPASLAAGWTLMLVAMMAPTLIAPILYVRLQSFRTRRARAVALFVTGYVLVWVLPAGALLTAITLAGTLFMGPLALTTTTVAAAAIWQCSPAKQSCLNRGHAHMALAAFGAAADRDAFCFGVTHAWWCVGSCWALMLVPMLLPFAQPPAMAAAAFLIVSERLDHAVAPQWTCRLSGKLLRLLVAQTRIRVQAVAS